MICRFFRKINFFCNFAIIFHLFVIIYNTLKYYLIVVCLDFFRLVFIFKYNLNINLCFLLKLWALGIALAYHCGHGYFIVFTMCSKLESKNNCPDVWKSEKNYVRLPFSLKVQKSENPLYVHTAIKKYLKQITVWIIMGLSKKATCLRGRVAEWPSGRN